MGELFLPKVEEGVHFFGVLKQTVWDWKWPFTLCVQLHLLHNEGDLLEKEQVDYKQYVQGF